MIRTILMSAVSLALAAPALAQTSELFFFNSDGLTFVVQNGSLVRQFNRPTSGDQVAAVAGDIRTIGNSSGQQGSQIDLSGSDLGGRYTQSVGDNFLDGTTDGRTYNYAIGNGSGQIYRYDRNWQNPTNLFQSAGSGAWSITYDVFNDTLWTYSSSDKFLRNYTLGGSLLNTYAVNDSQGDSYGLALDPVDGRIFLGDEDGSEPWKIYDRSGNFQGTLDMGAILGSPGTWNIHGAEFNIPAPGAGALLAAGALAAARRRRA